METREWYSRDISDIATEFKADLERGFGTKEAEERLATYGRNELPEGKQEVFFHMFMRQFQSPLIYVLFVACIIVFALGELTDGFVILFVLIFNAIVGTLQEGRAARTLSALKEFSETAATVLRDGKERVIRDTEVVPGDILLLREGEKIAADARIFDAENLFVDEAALTGESGGVTKEVKRLRRESISVGDRVNMVFKSTYVMKGAGRAIAVATGSSTEIGKISMAVQTIDTEIPLKRDIRVLAKKIVWAVGIFSAGLFLLGTALGNPASEMFLTAVSIAVSLVPEGLPVVLTLILARGVWRMAKQHALVKRLQAIEALGQAKVIAVDKTGTITKNEMVVRKIAVGTKLFDVSGDGYESKGELFDAGNIINPLEHSDVSFFGKLAALSVYARTSFIEESGTWRVSGDPTEAALVVFSEKIGFRRDDLLKEYPLLIEKPFDHKEKYHAFLYEMPRSRFLAVSGAPENLLERSKFVFGDGRANALTKERREEIEKKVNELSDEGMRVLAIAYAKPPTKKGKESVLFEVENLVFVGLLAIQDSLREGVAESVADAERAGIQVVMISGDYPHTAVAIARKVGIFHRGDRMLSGGEIEKMNDAELASRLEGVSVFARVTPEHKLRIIEGYRKRGETIAMTGDGVNDAPSLVAADLGVSMGKIGTEVAKEAADIVLLDDNFKTIVSAVREGRNIFQIIRKVLLYLFSTNVGEFFTIVGALLLGFPLPVLPVQILWLNLVTDSFPVIALALESEDPGLMENVFKRSRKLIDGTMLLRVVVMSVPMVVGTLILFGGAFQNNLEHALTLSLTALAVFQWMNVFNCRSERRSVFSLKNPANRYLGISLGAAVLLQLAVVYLPFLQRVFHTVPLSISEWLIIIAISFSIVFVEEIRKIFARRIAKL